MITDSEIEGRTFGDILRVARISAGKTMFECAAEIERSVGYYSDVENDRRNPFPDPTNIKKLATFLNISARKLEKIAKVTREKAKKKTLRLPNDADKAELIMHFAEKVERSNNHELAFARRIIDEQFIGE